MKHPVAWIAFAALVAIASGFVGTASSEAG